MKKILTAAIVFAIPILLILGSRALADADTRTQGSVIAQGIAGYPDLANSPAAVTTSGTSARTAADIPNYTTIRIYCTIETYFNLGGSTVTATTSNPRVAAGLPEVFSMGPYTRIAFITGGSAGSCDVTVLR